MGGITQSQYHRAVNARHLIGIISGYPLRSSALVSLQMKALRWNRWNILTRSLSTNVADLGFDVWLVCPKAPVLYYIFFFMIRALLTLVFIGWMLAHILVEYYFRKDTGLMGHQQEHSLIVLEFVTRDSVWRTLGFWFKLLGVCPKSSND